MKKIVSFLLAVAMLLCMIPMASAAALPFNDVPSDAWYASYVEYVYENGLMNGTSATQFTPNGSMTRGMVVTVLYRMAGSPSTSGSHPFTDVSKGEWYEAPIAWAYENEIVTGTSATTFAPKANVTREQLVTIFFRYANSSGYDVSNLANLSGYADASAVGSYALEAFQWAVASGIVSGTDATHLTPRGNATRAQCAAIIQRFENWIDNNSSRPTEPESGTTEEQEALATAKQYLSVMPFSYNGLIDQLEYEGYSHAACVYAADNCGADWYEQAVLMARDYLDSSAFSASGLYDQLIYEEFTEAQAQYGVDNCGADWYAEALECAEDYLDYRDFTYDELYDQLIYEGFTEDQVEYAMENCSGSWNDSNSSDGAVTIPSEDPDGTAYILNTNTMKFHDPSCSSVESISEEHKVEWIGNRDDLIAAGYEPCGRCDP